MISPLNLPIDTTTEMVGIVLEHIKPAPKEGEKLKLYIPTLMPRISKGSPAYRTVKSSGKQLFLNDVDCRPAIHNTIQAQNFITAYAENRIDWKYSTEKEIKYESTDDRYGYTSDGKHVTIIEKIREYYTVIDEKVSCYAPAGKFSKMMFNTYIYFDTEKYPDE